MKLHLKARVHGLLLKYMRVVHFLEALEAQDKSKPFKKHCLCAANCFLDSSYVSVRFREMNNIWIIVNN